MNIGDKINGIEFLGKMEGKRGLFKCHCGKVWETNKYDVKYKKISSCGCSRIKDITGKRFGRLKVLYRLERKTKNRNYYWLCECDHGGKGKKTKCEISSSELLRSKKSVKSCGCIRKEALEKLSGENSPNWNKNLTNEERMNNRDYHEYNKWRKLVYERDNYTCQVCLDVEGGNLVAHHLNGYSWYKKGRTNIKNGITLCEICHDDFHTVYGKKNNTEEQFFEHLWEELNE